MLAAYGCANFCGRMQPHLVEKMVGIVEMKWSFLRQTFVRDFERGFVADGGNRILSLGSFLSLGLAVIFASELGFLSEKKVKRYRNTY